MYFLSYDIWVSIGCPDIEPWLNESTDDGFWLIIDQTDTDGNNIPDILDDLAGGGDVVINPSHGVVVG